MTNTTIDLLKEWIILQFVIFFNFPANRYIKDGAGGFSKKFMMKRTIAFIFSWSGIVWDKETKTNIDSLPIFYWESPRIKF